MKKAEREVYVLKQTEKNGYYNPGLHGTNGGFSTVFGGLFTDDIAFAKFYKDAKGPERALSNKSTYIWDKVRPVCKAVKVKITFEEEEI